MSTHRFRIGQSGLCICLSENAKTGLSLNSGFDTCSPSKLCPSICYCKRRPAADVGPGMSNNSPITWQTQQAMYSANSLALRAFVGTDEASAHALAEKMADLLHRRHNGQLRINGQGDLIAGTVRLIVLLAQNDVLCWGFTRKPGMLHLLRKAGRGLSHVRRPFFHGSVDASTTKGVLDCLRGETRRLNGQPTLAAAVLAGTPNHSGQVSLEALAARRWIDSIDGLRVVFGYHGSGGKTVLGHPLECPATRGDAVVCADCRRCYGES